LSGTTCYFVSTDTDTWAGAVTACEGMSASLATIEDETIDTAIKDEMTEDTWIGLNDPTEAKSWEWTEDASALGTYAPWYGSNPGSVTSHTCVIKKFKQDGKWDDVGCNKNLPYVCTMAATCG